LASNPEQTEASQRDKVTVPALLYGRAKIGGARRQEAMIYGIALKEPKFLVAMRIWPNLNAPKASSELFLHVGLANPQSLAQIRTFTPRLAAARNASMAGAPVQNIIIAAFLEGRSRLYSIDLELA
jgi:hypothetical protein